MTTLEGNLKEQFDEIFGHPDVVEFKDNSFDELCVICKAAGECTCGEEDETNTNE